MIAKRVLQVALSLGMLAAALPPNGSAAAWGGCSDTVTVQWGDTLTGIAWTCDTTVAAIRAANPGLGWQLYAGQVLRMPSAGAPPGPSYPPPVGATYVVRWGDTLGKIAYRYGVSLHDLIAVNPQIWWPDLIFPGQVINLPSYAANPPQSPPSCYYGCNYPPQAPPTSCPQGCYYPTPQPTPTAATPPIDYSQYRWIKVTYKHGLIVRTGPGRSFPEIQSPRVGAIKGSTWLYRKNSVTKDSTGLVWVEVQLGTVVNGYSVGWIMVSDQYQTYFTDPEIDH
jgi:LysM repeat protein